MVQPRSVFCDSGVADWLHFAGEVLAHPMQPQCCEVAGPMDATSTGSATGSNARKCMIRIEKVTAR
jgi:hypothetical protein